MDENVMQENNIEEVYKSDHQLEFKNVSFGFGEDALILDDISFFVDEGEFVFLVGPSGAGKTTIVKLLTRELLTTEGEIYFDGYANIADIEIENLPELRRKIGVVFQDFKVLNSKTVFENVSVALEVVGTSQTEINDVVPNVLGLVGLADKVDKFPTQLSGGEKQRLSIARALAHEPDVLIADEPTGMIDPDAAKEVLNILEKINSLGTTIIMSTHDYNIVDQLKKRVIRIEDGKITSDKKEGGYND